MSFRKTIAVLLTGLALFLAGCSSSADTASRNISTAAENFEVMRHIVGVNGITDKYAFEVVGRCSVETTEAQIAGSIEIICRHGPNDYRRHNVGLSDNVFYVVEQLEPIDVSVYHTRIIIKPETLLPEFELQTGRQ